MGFGICAAALSGAACAKAQAKSAPDGPPLEMPAPPPRVIATVDEPLASEPAEVPDPAPAPATAARRPARRPASEPEPKPEPSPPSDAVPAAAPAERPAEPSRALRVPGRDSAEKPIREKLTLAQRDLARVDYGRLSQDGRTQYEQSKRFSQQAEQALKDQNFVFAATLADKAATIAAELLGK